MTITQADVPSLAGYHREICSLPPGDPSYADLIARFTISVEGHLRIVYAPFDHVNPAARIALVGITPGLFQAQRAFSAARESLLRGLDPYKAGKSAKSTASFSGPMRKNLCSMLDEIGAARLLGLSSTHELFEGAIELLHSTSAVRYPVFWRDGNFTGHNQVMMKHPLLKAYVDRVLAPELASVPDALVVPLGKAVEEVVAVLVSTGRLDRARCLFGFPHPSGGNGHRMRQFRERRDDLTRTIDGWFARAVGRVE